MTRLPQHRRVKTIVADVVALKAGAAILFGEIKAMSGASRLGIPSLNDRIREIIQDGFRVEHAMFCDTGAIEFFRVGSDAKFTSILTLKTFEILGHYDPEIGRLWVTRSYLEVLLRTWLRDFAEARWERSPPARTEMTTVGLADALAGSQLEPEFSFRLRC